MKNKLKYLLLAFCFLVCFSGFSQTDKQKELEEKRQAILQEIQQINSLLFKTRGEKKSVLTEVEDLSQRIAARENLIRVTNQQANLLTREINDNLNKIDQLRDELKELKEDYAALIRRSYRSKSQQNRVMFLLSSDNFLQAYKRLQYMKQYAKHRKKQGESIKEKTALLQILNKNLIDQKSQKQALIEENKLAKIKLTEEKKDQEGLIASLKKDEGKFATQIRSKQKEAEAIDKQIDDLIRAAIAESNRRAAEEAKKAGTTTNTATTTTVTPAKATTFALTPEAKALAANFTSNKGNLIWPVEKGVVTESFGVHQHKQFPNVTTNNSGVDITTEPDASVRAVFDGEVMGIQEIKGANKAVMIRHGDYITVYRNLATVAVKKGDKVSTKQNIGTVYNNPTTGKTTLKFNIYKNGTKMNPADWIYRM
jgi:septal ring factor EnvC (AmiA/AmiB activator)